MCRCGVGGSNWLALPPRSLVDPTQQPTGNVLGNAHTQVKTNENEKRLSNNQTNNLLCGFRRILPVVA